MKSITIEEALKLTQTIIVDVRTPLEYNEDHIPGSINIPLFDDEERAIIGTLYKEKGKEIAVNRGIEFTSPKLQEFYKKYLMLSLEYKQIVIYCFRGGMRSASLSSFLNEMGLNIVKLEGGYKAYRNYVLDFIELIPRNYYFIVLHGNTGTGKTEILEELDKLGCSVINLESLAKNSGSVYGEIFYSGNPPSQKYFDSLIVDILRNSDNRNILLESESKKIGRIILSKSFWESMLKGKHILVEASNESRVKRLVDDYTKNNKDKDEYLKKSTLRLKDSLGIKAIEELIQKIEIKEYTYVANFLINNYYDNLYQYSIAQYNYNKIVNSNNISQSIKDIFDFYNNI